MQLNVMIDTETLSTQPNAVTLQIGAVVFDNQQILDEFEVTIDTKDARKHGDISVSTLLWWLEQSEEARLKVMNGKDTVKSAVEKFNKFIIPIIKPDTLFWAHATFDFPVLQSLHKAVNYIYPIPYKQCRDLRTLEHFYAQKYTWPPRDKVGHTALNDARYQALNTIELLKIADTDIQRRLDN